MLALVALRWAGGGCVVDDNGVSPALKYCRSMLLSIHGFCVLKAWRFRTQTLYPLISFRITGGWGGRVVCERLG